jgi:hypothetical protein
MGAEINGQAISTSGMTVKYAVEATAGTRPTTGYTEIPDILDVPDLAPAPGTIESTPLNELQYVQYIDDLIDVGGAVTFNARLTEELFDAWDDVIAAFDGLTGGKAMWFEIAHPLLTKSFFLAGKPAVLGLSAASARALAQTTLNVTPNNVVGFATKSTS